MLKKKDIEKKLFYPRKIVDRPGSSFIQFTIYERKNRDDTPKTDDEGVVTSPTGSVPIQTIFLYMPERAVAPNTISWGEGSLGVIGHTGAKTITDVAGALPTSLGGSGFSAEKAGMILGNVAGTIGEAALTYMPYNLASYALQGLGAQNLDAGTLMGVVGGKIPNPYVTLLFKGVNLRTFEFQFKLYPHDIHERDAIQKIIACFRGYALPTSESGGGSVFFKYPPFFTIQYFYNKKPSEYLHRFKKSALIAVDVDYTNSGMWSITRDGFPTEISLNLRFQEEEILLQDDVLDQGY
jgi:hypothetical protein